MTTNNIIINEKATIKAEGKIRNRNAKPVICLDTGEVFTSIMDAAEKNEVHYSAMSNHIRGRYKTCNGKHFCLLSEVDNHLDQMTANIRYMYERNRKLESEYNEFLAWKAEQEAVRKAEEKKQAEIEKLEAEHAKCINNRERFKAKEAEEDEKIMAIERKLEMLKANAPAIA